MKKFTLIGLLVVISILGILMSLLLPALSNAKRASRTALCISNFKQVGIATFMFNGDHGVLPEEFRKVEEDFDYLMSKDSGIWECPEDQGTWGYGYNGNTPMNQKGKTTYEAEGSSYWWNERAVSRLYHSDGSSDTRLQQNDMSLERVLEPTKYTLISCAAIRGPWGSYYSGSTTAHLWHYPGETKWPIGFADGHAAMINDSRAPTHELMNGNSPNTDFIIKQPESKHY